MNLNHPKRFLIAPLDWGLGHATRCIPVIRELLAQGHAVVIAAAGRPAALLHDEFPAIKIVPIINYNITYAVSPLLLALKFPGILLRTAHCACTEHLQVRRIVEVEHIDCVISDSRFGCFDRRTASILISHQFCLKMPTAFAFLERLSWLGLCRMARRFTHVWIPDLPGAAGLTGDLTRRFPLPPHARYIGLLSRFSRDTAPAECDPPLDLLVSLSGPEPQRTLLEKAVVAELKTFMGTVAILRGKAGEKGETNISPAIRMIPHASGEETRYLMRRAAAVLCRGGYTTIMELISLGKKAVLVPTPGQTEQEYLCGFLAQKGMFVVQKQSDLNIKAALKELDIIDNCTYPETGLTLLREAIAGI